MKEEVLRAQTGQCAICSFQAEWLKIKGERIDIKK